jgi:transaldolase
MQNRYALRARKAATLLVNRTLVRRFGTTSPTAVKEKMKATQQLHELGQSLWLDSISRDLLNSGALKRYIEEWSVTGLTSNLTVFADGIRNSTAYDDAIHKNLKEEKLGQDLYFELAIGDLCHAADLLRPIYDRTDGVDGWVSLEVSPLLSHDSAGILAAARDLYFRARRPNLFIAIPGTEEGLSAVEEAIAAGIPVNVTLLFSREHYLAAADAFLRGIERRITAGLRPNIACIVSLFLSHWDAAVVDDVPKMFRNQLGIAIARRTYKAYRELLSSQRWERAYNAGARPQRILWTETGSKSLNISNVFYIKALTAPLTVNAMSAVTLEAFDEHGELDVPMPADGGDCEAVLARFDQAGINIDALATLLQSKEADLRVKSWFDLMTVIASRSAALAPIHHIDGAKEAIV